MARPTALPKSLRQLLTLPTAPFAEGAVLDYLQRACERLPGVRVTADRHGNLVVRYQRRVKRTAPLVFTAHTDHPGFVAQRMIDGRTLLAAFRGWVEPEYFRRERVRFWSSGAWTLGRVSNITKTAPVYGMIGRTGRPEEVEISVKRPIEAGAPGMWDLTDPLLRGGLLHARGCDDIAGAAALLAMLERLSKRDAAADVIVLFTRAEEVGFVGAIAAARDGTIPKRSPVIAIETSKALPNARQGEGPILRVGDKSSVFTPTLTAFCDRVAKDLAARRKGFKYQRRLMDGGTCESTAYLAYGYAATGICVALGNYHNMNVDRQRIAAETIDIDDWRWMVDWFEALALAKGDWREGDAGLRSTMDARFETYRELLGRGVSP